MKEAALKKLKGVQNSHETLRSVALTVAWSFSSVDLCSLRRYSVKLLQAIGDNGSLCLWDRGLCTCSFQRDLQKETCDVCFKHPGWTERDIKVGACITLWTQVNRCGRVINKRHHEVTDYTLGAKVQSLRVVTRSIQKMRTRKNPVSLQFSGTQVQFPNPQEWVDHETVQPGKHGSTEDQPRSVQFSSLEFHTT